MGKRYLTVNFIALITSDSEGTSLVVQWLRLHAPNAGGLGFDPWSEKEIPHAATNTQHSQRKQKTKIKVTGALGRPRGIR